MVEQDTIIGNRYHIRRLLGKGGMGNVYAAYDAALGRDVAVKLLRADLATDPEARARFVREAQIAAQINHPHVVHTYDVDESAECPFLVQELIEGHTLDTQIPVRPRRALTIAIAIADALDYIHSQGYVHCDIKPQNIMLVKQDEHEHVMLLDFGIARAQDDDTTTLIATPYYVAPERAQGGAPTAAADLYSLGIVLYHMLTGRLPFDAPTVPEIINAHLYEPLPPLALDVPNTLQMEGIVQKLTAKQPEERYASAAELCADLQSAYEGVEQTRSLHALARRLLRPVTSMHHMLIVSLPVLVLCLLLTMTWIHGFDTRATAADPARLAHTEQIPGVLNVPDIRGLSVDQARLQIEGAGLRLVVGESVPSNQPIGTVTNSIPAPDQLVTAGTQVVVQISAGPTGVPTAITANATPPLAAIPSPTAAGVASDRPTRIPVVQASDSTAPTATATPPAVDVDTPSAAAPPAAAPPAKQEPPAQKNEERSDKDTKDKQEQKKSDKQSPPDKASKDDKESKPDKGEKGDKDKKSKQP